MNAITRRRTVCSHRSRSQIASDQRSQPITDTQILWLAEFLQICFFLGGVRSPSDRDRRFRTVRLLTDCLLERHFKFYNRSRDQTFCDHDRNRNKIAHRRSLAIFAADLSIAGNSAVGIKFVPFNRRENRRSLAIFFAKEIAHLGALKIARFCGGAVKIAAATAENRAILVHSDHDRNRNFDRAIWCSKCWPNFLVFFQKNHGQWICMRTVHM